MGHLLANLTTEPQTRVVRASVRMLVLRVNEQYIKLAQQVHYIDFGILDHVVQFFSIQSPMIFAEYL